MTTKSFGARPILLVGLPAAAALAAVINILLYLIVTEVLDRPMEFTMGPDMMDVPFDISAIIIMGSIVPAILGALVLMALVRYVRRPVMVFYVIAAVGLIASWGGIVMMVNADADYTPWVLSAMHTIAVASIAVALGLSAPEQSSVAQHSG